MGASPQQHSMQILLRPPATHDSLCFIEYVCCQIVNFDSPLEDRELRELVLGRSLRFWTDVIDSFLSNQIRCMTKPEHCLVHGQSLMSLRDPKYHVHPAAKAEQAAGIAFCYSIRQDLV
jgi:hypothetical protein